MNSADGNPTNPETPAQKSPVRRGGNYSESEDVAIARAYINVSLDPVIGTDQKEAKYYERIWHVYKEKKPEDAITRPLTSVQTRVKTMVKECVRFAACYRSIVAMRKSGFTEDDNIRLATALFNKVKISHPREDVGKPFRFLKAWEVVRDLPKFMAAADGSSAGVESGSGTNASEKSEGETAAEGEEKSVKKRPDGRRKAKQEQADQHVRAKKLKLAEAAVRLQEQQVEEITRRNEILLFTNGPGGADSEMAREFFKLKQEEALQNMRARMRAKEVSDASYLHLPSAAAEEGDE